jgi:putative transposase
MRLFDRSGDYALFLDLFRQTQQLFPIRCLAYCLMPNHFHLVLWPRYDGEMSTFMFRFTTTHSKRWHMAHGSNGTGAVYQGRFKSFPVCLDDHFFCVCRYVERNAVRAGLAERAVEWPWSSAAQRNRGRGPVYLSDWPLSRPADWDQFVDSTEPAEEIRRLRAALIRSAPFGPEPWRTHVARDLSLEKSVAAIGRPRTPKPGVLFSGV